MSPVSCELTGDSGGELRDTFTLVDVALDVAAYLGRFGEVQERARGDSAMQKMHVDHFPTCV